MVTIDKNHLLACQLGARVVLDGEDITERGVMQIDFAAGEAVVKRFQMIDGQRRLIPLANGEIVTDVLRGNFRLLLDPKKCDPVLIANYARWWPDLAPHIDVEE